MLVIKIRMMKTSQMIKREITRFSLKMLIIGQLKKRAPRMNKKIKTSLLIARPPAPNQNK
jgi:hypothetical protein